MRSKHVQIKWKVSRGGNYVPKKAVWIILPIVVLVLVVNVLLVISNRPNPRHETSSAPVNFVISATVSPPVVSAPVIATASSTTPTTASSSATSHSVSSQSSSSSSAASTTLNCSDCWLAAVDKTTALKSSYAPVVVPSGLPGGNWKLTSAARAALTELFAAANAAGIEPEIVSGYRSYQEQETAFNYWVNQELVAGYDRATAIERANVYSAKPGHSEHQLGTTVDLKAKNNEPFTDTTGNQQLYGFLLANAHKYGYVISYPQGKEQLTGYKYEPWHIRYIGKELAGEIYSQGYLSSTNSLYLAKFLRER